MKKVNILAKNNDFNRIIKSGKPIKKNNYIIYLEKTNENQYHFGFSVGKKIGNAEIRNRIKRQLKSIIDEKNYQNGFNCIIIVKKGILNCSYQQMKSELLECLSKLNIIKKESNDA